MYDVRKKVSEGFGSKFTGESTYNACPSFKLSLEMASEYNNFLKRRFHMLYSDRGAGAIIFVVKVSIVN